MSGIEYDFECSACGHKQKTLKHVKACPMCGLGGFNMIHKGPIVITDVMRLPPGYRVKFKP